MDYGACPGLYATGCMKDYRALWAPGHPYYPMRRRVIFFVTDKEDENFGSIYVDGVLFERKMNALFVSVDLDRDSDEEIWEKISTHTALVYFVYKGDNIHGALVSSAGKSSYSITYVTDGGMRSTRIRRLADGGGATYERDEYYTELAD